MRIKPADTAGCQISVYAVTTPVQLRAAAFARASTPACGAKDRFGLLGGTGHVGSVQGVQHGQHIPVGYAGLAGRLHRGGGRNIGCVGWASSSERCSRPMPRHGSWPRPGRLRFVEG